jgi:hypothetical protein
VGGGGPGAGAALALALASALAVVCVCGDVVAPALNLPGLLRALADSSTHAGVAALEVAWFHWGLRWGLWWARRVGLRCSPSLHAWGWPGCLTRGVPSTPARPLVLHLLHGARCAPWGALRRGRWTSWWLLGSREVVGDDGCRCRCDCSEDNPVAAPAAPCCGGWAGVVAWDAATAAVVASAMDADHFLAARSLTLADATALPARPAAHSLLFVAAVVGALWGLRRACAARGHHCAEPVWRRGVAMAVLALVSHQLRDALRRGLWLPPLGSGPPLPYPAYAACLVAMPLVASWWVAGAGPVDAAEADRDAHGSP